MFGLRGRRARRQSIHTPRFHRFESLEQRIALSGTPPTVTDVSVSSTQWSSAYISYLEDSLLGSGGYSVPAGSGSQATPLPWSNLDQIHITFSEDVNVQAADLALTGANTTSYTFSNFFYDPQSRVATWTLSAPLTKDRLLIDLDADGIDPIADLDENVLDGEWANSSDTYQTGGNGVEGGDFEFLLNVLPGEVNSTMTVNSVDYYTAYFQIGKSTTSSGYDFKCDVDGSGLIDSNDSQFVLSKMNNTIPMANPAGLSNDAPSASPIAPAKITNAAADFVISLWNNFDDNENSATGLTYSVAGNTAASLFDYVTINSSTGELILNAKSGVAGIAKITISATDSGGITTHSAVHADIGGYNQPPIIIDPTAEDLTNHRWRISGTVSDDQDVTGLIVVLSGVFTARAVVYPDGTFSCVVTLPDDPTGWESMEIADGLVDWSDIAEVHIG